MTHVSPGLLILGTMTFLYEYHKNTGKTIIQLETNRHTYNTLNARMDGKAGYGFVIPDHMGIWRI